ncbi:MAG: SusD/RagB family nutrient-binding outer membrane lipoprotein, partial [Bacteroidota bacterium]
MKLLHKLLIIISMVGLSACNLFELDDYLENPNAVSPENAGIDFLYNNVQLQFENFVNSTFFFTADVSRQTAMTGAFTYNGSYNPQSFNGIWSLAYSEVLPDINALNAIAEERDLGIYSGTAKIIEAYVLFTLVDLFDDVPFTEAFQGTDIISPNSDPGSSVYEVAINLLDEAIAELEAAETAAPSVDIFYDGDKTKWITLAKTLKLRAFIQTRLIDSSAGDKINAIVAEGDIIDTEEEDFQFQFGTNRLNPNSRHPFYTNSYEAVDGAYMNNWYMWLLIGEKETRDPRSRFYFYRQDGDLTDESSTVFSCIFSTFPDQDLAPDHYPAV